MAKAQSKKQRKTEKKPADENTAPNSTTPFIDTKNAMEAFTSSEKWMRDYYEPIEEYERIARNRPSDRIAKGLPRVTDGTMAAIVQEQPKRIIQQIATGKVECHDFPEYAKIADLIHRKKLLPLYNRMGTALQKHWNMLGKSMTWGRATSYTFFTATNNQMHTDFVIPYIRDIITEKGKVYAPDSNVSFMRSWYQKRDIQAIIRREKQFMELDKNYKSDWDLKLLADFMSEGASAKPAELQSPAEREKSGDSGGYEVIHAFQDGVGAEFYSFAPRFRDGKTFRTKPNSDPRGVMPLDHLYCNIDLSNPLGRGQVELSGGVQNLIDQQMQMFQFLTTMLMGPPLQKWGDVKTNTLKFRPNAIWDMGTNQANKVEPYQVSNHAIQQFGGNYGLLKSQIYNLNSSQDHSVSAESGNISQSKTQAGVKASEARLGVSDNYLRKQFETWFAHQTETSLNVYLSEMEGEEVIPLTKQEVKECQKDEYGARQYLKDSNLVVPYKDIQQVSFKFEVIPDSSEVKEDLENSEKLAAALKLVQSSEDPQIRAAEAKIMRKLINEIGAEGTDDILPEDDDQEQDPDGQQRQQIMMQQMAQQIMPAVQQMIQEAVQQAKLKPEPDQQLEMLKALDVDFESLPEGTRQQILQSLGLASGEQTPVDRKQDIEAFEALGRATPQERQQQQQPGAQQPSGARPQNGQQQQQNGALNPDEQQFVEALLNQGFSEQDVEQGVILKRQGRSLEEIISVLGAKYVQR